jgi:hypothetical protein
MRDGYGFIAGRSAKNARAALDAADAAGVDQREVEAVDGGYEVPIAVLDAYEKATGVSGAKSNAETKPDAVKAKEDTTGDDTSDTNEPSEPEEPPRAGAGSGTEAWTEWAQEVHGYDPAEGLSRKELIERYGE